MHFKVKHDYLYILDCSSQTLIKNISEVQLISAGISQFLAGSTLFCLVCVCECVIDHNGSLTFLFTCQQTVPQPSLTWQGILRTQMWSQLREIKKFSVPLLWGRTTKWGLPMPRYQEPHQDVRGRPLGPSLWGAWLRNRGPEFSGTESKGSPTEYEGRCLGNIMSGPWFSSHPQLSCLSNAFPKSCSEIIHNCLDCMAFKSLGKQGWERTPHEMSLSLYSSLGHSGSIFFSGITPSDSEYTLLRVFILSENLHGS